jgi:hypothetical protein
MSLDALGFIRMRRTDAAGMGQGPGATRRMHSSMNGHCVSYREDTRGAPCVHSLLVFVSTEP